jgi:hypothetical protein
MVMEDQTGPFSGRSGNVWRDGMGKIRHSLLALAVAASVQLGTSVAAQEQDTRQYILATATTGGTYYPVGVALATLTKVKLEPTDGIAMSANSSAGSGENVKLLREDQAQFAILQALFGAWAAIHVGWQPTSLTGSVGTFTAAYLTTKVTYPIRIATTLAVTPVVARYWGRLRS